LSTPELPKGLQHTLNNPLAALLAELQLMEMDDLAPTHRDGVERSIALCRRLIRIVREQIPPDAP
jgi:signal transduction histidine kinase